MTRRLGSLGAAVLVVLLGWFGSGLALPAPLAAGLLPFRLTRGVIREGRGDHTGAARIYRSMAEGGLHRSLMAGWAAGAYRNAATRHLAAGEDEAAVEGFQRAARLETPGMLPLVLEGVAWQRRGDPATARERFLQATAVASGTQDPKIALANLAFIQGDREEAQVWYERALRSDPTNPLALVNWGDALRWQGEDEAAESLFRRAHELNPRQPEPLLRLAALILDRGGEPSEAQRYLESVRRHRPDHPELAGLERRLAGGSPGPEPQLVYAHRLLHQQRVLFNLQRPPEPVGEVGP